MKLPANIDSGSCSKAKLGAPGRRTPPPRPSETAALHRRIIVRHRDAAAERRALLLVRRHAAARLHRVVAVNHHVDEVRRRALSQVHGAALFRRVCVKARMHGQSDTLLCGGRWERKQTDAPSNSCRVPPILTHGNGCNASSRGELRVEVHRPVEAADDGRGRGGIRGQSSWWYCTELARRRVRRKARSERSSRRARM